MHAGQQPTDGVIRRVVYPGLGTKVYEETERTENWLTRPRAGFFGILESTIPCFNSLSFCCITWDFGAARYQHRPPADGILLPPPLFYVTRPEHRITLDTAGATERLQSSSDRSSPRTAARELRRALCMNPRYREGKRSLLQSGQSFYSKPQINN